MKGRAILCFGGEDWWYHHPHANNHLMKRFARDNQVVFVNSISMGLPGLGSPELFTKIRRKLHSYVKYLRRTPEGIWVVTPIVSPFFKPCLAADQPLAPGLSNPMASALAAYREAHPVDCHPHGAGYGGPVQRISGCISRFG